MYDIALDIKYTPAPDDGGDGGDGMNNMGESVSAFGLSPTRKGDTPLPKGYSITINTYYSPILPYQHIYVLKPSYAINKPTFHSHPHNLFVDGSSSPKNQSPGRSVKMARKESAASNRNSPSRQSSRLGSSRHNTMSSNQILALIATMNEPQMLKFTLRCEGTVKT